MGRRSNRVVAHATRWLVVTASAALLAACAGGPARGCAIGNGAPRFASTDLDGHAVRLTDFSGQRVVVNFWASWCTPCRDEFSVLKELQSSTPGLRVVGVVFQDSEGPARSFARQEGATWPSVVDPKGQIAAGYCVAQKPGIPVSVAIDDKGTVRARQLGPLTTITEARKFVDRALPHSH